MQAGQEIDVSWGSMGHAGGYVRLALAPKWWMSFDIVDDDNDGSGNQDDQVIFSSNVIKYDCFGGGTWRVWCSARRIKPCAVTSCTVVP